MATELTDLDESVQEYIETCGIAMDGTHDRVDDVPIRNTRHYYDLKRSASPKQWSDFTEWAEHAVNNLGRGGPRLL